MPEAPPRRSAEQEPRREQRHRRADRRSEGRDDGASDRAEERAACDGQHQVDRQRQRRARDEDREEAGRQGGRMGVAVVGERGELRLERREREEAAEVEDDERRDGGHRGQHEGDARRGHCRPQISFITCAYESSANSAVPPTMLPKSTGKVKSSSIAPAPSCPFTTSRNASTLPATMCANPPAAMR